MPTEVIEKKIHSNPCYTSISHLWVYIPHLCKQLYKIDAHTSNTHTHTHTPLLVIKDPPQKKWPKEETPKYAHAETNWAVLYQTHTLYSKRVVVFKAT